MIPSTQSRHRILQVASKAGAMRTQSLPMSRLSQESRRQISLFRANAFKIQFMKRDMTSKAPETVYTNHQRITKTSLLTTTQQQRYLSIPTRGNNNVDDKKVPGSTTTQTSSSSSSSVDPSSPPPETLEESKARLDASKVPEEFSTMSIEQMIAELNLNPETAQSSSSSSTSSSQEGPEGGERAPPPRSEPKQKSRFFFFLYLFLYWSAIGSIPVHLLKSKNDTKEFKERLEWKISVLTDMRDKLKRGESIEEEEAMLTIGMDRSKREMEHKVDESYFEDLMKDAEKLDFVFGAKEEAPIPKKQAPQESAPRPTPPPTTITRRPPPPSTPKSESSYL